MKKHLFCVPLAASLILLGAGPARAQAPAAATSDSHSGHHAAASAQPAELSEGEITRWDPRTLRVTLRHGEIKNLEMPPMTMVFRVQDAGVLGDLKTGDKVIVDGLGVVQMTGAKKVQTQPWQNPANKPAAVQAASAPAAASAPTQTTASAPVAASAAK